jgi:hypothetical protein
MKLPFGSKSEDVKPIEVVTKPIERTPLALPDPSPLRTKPIEWIIITTDNHEEVFKRLESKGQQLVLFALTDEGYQQLAITMSEIRNLINTQRIIIGKYKEYYETKKEDPPKK